ncbi:type IV secretion system protein VirB11 [Paraburkholderia sp. GAS32]
MSVSDIAARQSANGASNTGTGLLGSVARRQISDQETVNFTLGPLRQYLDDPTVFELRINKYCQVVKVTTKGRILVDDLAIDYAYLKKLTASLLSLNRLPEQPVNDLKLPDGSRVVICWPPAVLEGTVLISIRKHLEINKTLEELESEGRFDDIKVRTLTEAMDIEPFEQKMLDLLAAKDYKEFYRAAVLSHRNICICGSTGSGKTVLHRTLLDLVPATERVLVLEDIHEVNSDRLHEIGYMTYGTSEGRISAAACLKACMRLSPDRIFLTELRDDAAWNFLNAANTGHPGAIFTTHADSARQAPGRIADLVKASPVGLGLDYDMILRAIHQTVDVYIFMKKWGVREILYDPRFKKSMFEH